MAQFGELVITNIDDEQEQEQEQEPVQEQYYDVLKNFIDGVTIEYFRPILILQSSDDEYIYNMLYLIKFITMNVIFNDIYTNIENIILGIDENDIENIKEQLLSDYANETFIGSFDNYQNDIVDVFTKYQIKVTNHSFIIMENNDVTTEKIYNLQNVF
jgi:hypothetical protein